MKRPLIVPKEDCFPSGGFPLVVLKHDMVTRAPKAEDSTPFHTHEFSELVVVTRGSGMHLTPQESWPIAAGDVFVIKGHQMHGYADANNLHLINIIFEPEKLNIPKRDLQGLSGYHALFTLSRIRPGRKGFQSRLRLSANDLSTTKILINQLENELATRTPGFRLIARALFMQLVGFLSRCYDASPSSTRRDLTRIAEAIAFLENNYDKEIYIDDLAAMAHMSRRNFHRVFLEAMEKSPMAYLVSLRVAHAAELLRGSRINITEAGLRAGFEDSNYFARQFRSLMGMSPRQYARQTLLPRTAGQ